MASGPSGGLVVVVFALSVVLAPRVSAGDKECLPYGDQSFQKCTIGYCCGSCLNRYCCTNSFLRFTEDEQEECAILHSYDSLMPMILGIVSLIVFFLIFVCCCVCPCCCLYKMCRKPRPVIATSTHTTVVTTAPQQYPRQPTATPGQHQSYQGVQYQVYQPQPVQPGYGAQPGPQGYGAQSMPQGYGGQPMGTSPYPGQALVAGPPPSYQEATGPGFPPNPMPYSQAAFSPGQPPYPLQPPVQPQPPGPTPHKDYLSQPAYNPDFTG
ncbi:protein shisa-5-like [Spinachia spinachia]